MERYMTKINKDFILNNHDLAFRKKLRDNPRNVLKMLNTKINTGDYHIKVVTNTKDQVFLVMPDVSFVGSEMGSIVAASETVGSVSSIGCVASASTFSTALSIGTSISSTGCAATAGSIGSAGTVDVRGGV